MSHVKLFRLAAAIGMVAAVCPFAFGQGFPESSRRICFGDYAFCSAATCTPNGQQIKVHTATGDAEFPAATCTCPVLRGADEVEVDGGNMEGSCKAPDPATVWSGFWLHASAPQQLSNWENAEAPGLFCGRDLNLGNQTVNCYSFKCKRAGTINGVEVATCTCPIGETLDGTALPPATAFFTQAGRCNISVCSQYPVSDPIGFDDVKKGGQCIRFPLNNHDELSFDPVWDNLMDGLSWDRGEKIASSGANPISSR
jgi:hypothetical protein